MPKIYINVDAKTLADFLGFNSPDPKDQKIAAEIKLQMIQSLGEHYIKPILNSSIITDLEKRLKIHASNVIDSELGSLKSGSYSYSIPIFTPSIRMKEALDQFSENYIRSTRINMNDQIENSIKKLVEQVNKNFDLRLQSIEKQIESKVNAAVDKAVNEEVERRVKEKLAKVLSE